MDEQFLYDFRTGCGNSAKFARIFDMGFKKSLDLFGQDSLSSIIRFREQEHSIP